MRKLERTLLLTVDFRKKGELWNAQERSQELCALATSAGATIAGEEIARRQSPSPAHFIGEGKAQEISERCAREKIDIVVFNNDLTGTQQKNLEEIIERKTIDRTQLILDIFARRAHSNEGKIQVELAQLLYLLPRLTGKGIMLSRLGGGIGTRGPGEQKLEYDRRKIRNRIGMLKKDLQDLRARRAMMRKHRKRFAALTAAIVGYTNAGKSTLLNALTDADVTTESRLFSTLDPTVRHLVLRNKQKIFFVDTVGFLNDLPVHLIEAFKATLEEVVESDLILHVVDISHPKAESQAEVTHRILREIGAGHIPVIPVLNKIDVIEFSQQIARLGERFDQAESVSARERIGLERLVGRIAAYLSPEMTTVALEIPGGDMKLINVIYENGRVFKREYRGDRVYLEAELPLRLKEIIEKQYPAAIVR
ncbi:MAG: GTPase HflX [Candidatus Omnitrophota bacterium]